jgi:hypothetical protein
MSEPEVYNVKNVKARKQYHCYECGQPISPGMFYERVKGLWDGVWVTFRTCFPCAEARLRMGALGYWVDDDEGSCFGSLAEWLNEMWLNTAELSVGRELVLLRRRIAQPKADEA